MVRSSLGRQEACFVTDFTVAKPSSTKLPRPCERERCLIQASGGTPDTLTAALATYPYPCEIFFNPLSQKAGGTAFLVQVEVRGQDDPRFRFQHQISAPGRVALLTIINDNDRFTTNLMNVHFLELDIRAQDKIRAEWRGLADWNLQDTATGAFLAAGDFNIKSGPTRSYVGPMSGGFAPGSVPAERSRGSQPVQAFWGRLFSMFIEISTYCPARYCRDTATAATLDR
eukprot:4403074-Pyramimonas_sp.AAC.1